MNPTSRRDLLANAPADLARPDRPRLHRQAGPGLDPGAGWAGPRRDSARRRQRRPQHGRPVRGRGVRQEPQDLEAGERPADQGVRRHRPAPGDGRRRASSWNRAGSGSSRASAIPTRTGRTSPAWRSGRPPGSTRKSTAAPAGWAGGSTRRRGPRRLFVGPGSIPVAIRGRRPWRRAWSGSTT